MARAPRDVKPQLQPREFQLAELVRGGLPAKRIAAILKIKPKSVDVKTSELAKKILGRAASRKVPGAARSVVWTWFEQKFPTAVSRRRGYAEACMALAEALLQRHRSAREFRSAESFLRKRPAIAAAGVHADTVDVPFTRREFEVCQVLVECGSNVEIAKELGIGEEAAKRYVSLAIQKAGMDNRISLALWFAQQYPDASAIKMGYAAAVARSLHGRRKPKFVSKLLRDLGK